MKKLKVAIIGSGNIGTDLLIKTLRSKILEVSVFLGRNIISPGMQKAKSLGVNISDKSIDYIINNPNCCDIVFDATSAESHYIHAKILKDLDKFVIDLTPAKVGIMCIPAINLEECLNTKNVNMITCGGQVSAPIAYAISTVHDNIEYIEVVGSIASKSAGVATRINLDEYIHTTESGIKYFSKTKKTKAILNLNPAEPSVNMQVTLFVKINNPNIEEINKAVMAMENKIQSYVPGYKITVPPTLENSRIAITVRVTGLGDYLPSYAGNLDIINCAAIEMAEQYANKFA